MTWGPGRSRPEPKGAVARYTAGHWGGSRSNNGEGLDWYGLGITIAGIVTGQPELILAGTTISVAGMAADNQPCKAERITFTIVLNAFGASVAKGFEAGGLRYAAPGTDLFTLAVEQTATVEC